LLLATFARSVFGLKWLCLAVAFCGLIYEGGCFAVAAGVGRATGGGASDDSWKRIIGLAFVIAIFWGVVIIGLSMADKDKKHDHEDCGTTIPENREPVSEQAPMKMNPLAKLPPIRK